MLGTGKYFGIGKEFKQKVKAVAENVANEEVTSDASADAIENNESEGLPKTYYLQKEYVTIIISVIFIFLFIFTH